MPTIGISVGLSSIAELQIDGGFYDHLSITSRGIRRAAGSTCSRSPATAPTTSRRHRRHQDSPLSETASRPAFAFRFATKLPNASNESGLGLDTTDFFMSLLGAKTVQSIRVVGNLGVGILAIRPNGNRQNDDLHATACRLRAR